MNRYFSKMQINDKFMKQIQIQEIIFEEVVEYKRIVMDDTLCQLENFKSLSMGLCRN